MSSAKEINDRLQAAISELPDIPEFPIGFAGSIKVIKLIADEIFKKNPRQNATPFPMPIPCYPLKNPDRFGLSDTEVLPIMSRAEMYAICKIDQIETESGITPAISKILYETYKKEFESGSNGVGILEIQWPDEIDINNLDCQWEFM